MKTGLPLPNPSHPTLFPSNRAQSLHLPPPSPLSINSNWTRSLLLSLFFLRKNRRLNSSLPQRLLRSRSPPRRVRVVRPHRRFLRLSTFLPRPRWSQSRRREAPELLVSLESGRRDRERFTNRVTAHQTSNIFTTFSSVLSWLLKRPRKSFRERRKQLKRRRRRSRGFEC
ncbi:hypothetical protein BDY24DRAFT_386433 [Mrakia frigida]|uniref:uncharacterized protein n=1 Tax=Mrakia frigida TaxID=29902 RepID=UPI003FCC1B23